MFFCLQAQSCSNTKMETATSQTACGISQRCFVMETSEANLHFQIIDLGRQYYVWISTGNATLNNLYMAIQTAADSKPALATVIAGPASSASPSLAQRLALKVKKPVLCSCNLPGNAPMLQAIAERRLLQELADMAHEGRSAQPAAAVGGPDGAMASV